MPGSYMYKYTLKENLHWLQAGRMRYRGGIEKWVGSLVIHKMPGGLTIPKFPGAHRGDEASPV